MAFDPGALNASLAAAVGSDPALMAELKTAFVESVSRQLDLLGRARCDANWEIAAARLKSIAASFGARSEGSGSASISSIRKLSSASESGGGIVTQPAASSRTCASTPVTLMTRPSLVAALYQNGPDMKRLVNSTGLIAVGWPSIPEL